MVYDPLKQVKQMQSQDMGGKGVLRPTDDAKPAAKKPAAAKPASSKPNPYVKAKAKDSSLDSYIKTRNANRDNKGSREYAIAQNKINEAYGVSKRYAVPEAAKTTPKVTKGLDGPEVERKIKPKTAAEVNAYANNPDNFKGRRSDMSDTVVKPDNKAVGKNDNITKLTGPIAKPGDIKDPGITSATDITGGQKPVGTNTTPKFEFRRGNQGESKADYTAAYDAAHDKFKKANPNAYKPLPASGNTETPSSKPTRTTLPQGVGSGMAQMDTQMKGMATMASDMTGGGKGLFSGIKARREAKKSAPVDATQPTLKQKSTTTPSIASNPSEAQSLFDSEYDKYL